MPAYDSEQVILRARPVGRLSPTDLALVRVPLPELDDGYVLVRNTWLSVDPYMRRRMNASRFYVPPFEVGAPLTGGAVGEVVASRSPRVPVGSIVQHEAGWRDVARLRDRHVQLIDTDLAPASAYLGVLGMPGLTAYVGLLDVAGLQPGDTVFVSGAAGAVGSLAAQLAVLRGHRVVASAGSAAKLAWLRDELGCDAVFDYHSGDVAALLAEAAPEGVDVYFDNVGHDHLRAAIACANNNARFALCGSISDYNDARPRGGPDNMFEVISRRLTLRGFIVSDHLPRRPTFLAEVGPLVRSGRVVYRETVVNGLGSAAGALVDLLDGANVGKMWFKL